MIQRYISTYINKLSASYPVVTLMGPRQSGKTTLAKALFPHHEYRNLEAEDIRVIAKADPRAFLHQGNARMVIDEIQRFPDLLTYIQEIVDERKMKGQFVLTGSHQPELNSAVSESLAGRTGIGELLPLEIGELRNAGFQTDDRDALIWNGFMPRHFDDGLDPLMLYRDYYHTYVQRDVRKLVNVQDMDSFTVFTKLLAGRAGQLLNMESLARDAGISVPTVAKWLSALEASYLVYRLRPYYNNFGKRQIKSPKIYFTDVGLLCYLLGIREQSQLFVHPLIGSIFENMVVVEALKHRLNRGLEPDLWFYRNSSGSIEIDLLIEEGGKLHAREIKSSSTYSARMPTKMGDFAALSPIVASSCVVYSGKTFENVAVDFRDVAKWCP